MRTLGILTLLLLSSCTAVQEPGRRETAHLPRTPAPLESATPEERRLFEEIKPLILKEARQPPLVLAENSEMYIWLVTPRIAPLIKAYQYSRDPEFLEVFVPLMEQILSQRYIHPTKKEWNGWWHYQGYDVVIQPNRPGREWGLLDDASFYFKPALEFALVVREDPALRARYGAKAEAWRKDVEESIRAFDQRGCWHDIDAKTGWYTETTEYPDPSGVIRQRDANDSWAGGSQEYYKVSALNEALALAYRLTGDAWYRARMEKTAADWRRRWREDEKHVEWNYRDDRFAGDYVSRVYQQGRPRRGQYVHANGSFCVSDVAAAVALYDVGVFFTQQDMEKLIRTNLEFMYRGDLPPTFRDVDGRTREASAYKYHKGGRLWTALAHFSPKTRELWKLHLDSARKDWMWHIGAMDYLLELSRPVSWEPRYAGK
jgi:hypothetical protein